MTNVVFQQRAVPQHVIPTQTQTNSVLDYYAQHSLITDPREYADLLAGLPADIAGLTRVVQGLLLHPFCVKLYNVQLSPRQREEVHLRSIPQMLARIREIDSALLTTPREELQLKRSELSLTNALTTFRRRELNLDGQVTNDSCGLVQSIRQLGIQRQRRYSSSYTSHGPLTNGGRPSPSTRRHGWPPRRGRILAQQQPHLVD